MDGVRVSAEANRLASAIKKWKRKAAYSKPSSNVDVDVEVEVEVNGAAAGTEAIQQQDCG